MWLDILIIITVILSMAQGYRRGLISTVLRAFGWLFSIVAAAIVYPYATDWLSGHTEIYDNIRLGLEERFSAHLSEKAGEIMWDIPAVVADAADKLVSALAVSVSDGLASVCFMVFVYIALVLSIKLTVFIITFLFSKRSRGRGGIISGIDGFLGLVFGAGRGIIVVFVLLALILPVSLFVGESANAVVSDALFSSMFAGELYANNPLLLLTDRLIGSYA
ncbi:MAG: CvpA family protein [Clostridiales Family XIII bacterium]|jgi:hypothetical protein|nr:CvpA family protein [Clostridiales Family XIII bacterium]